MLMIDQRLVDQLVAYAKLHPISHEEFMHLSGRALQEWKRRLDAYTIDLPVGYLVTYTLELQPIGLCHHISISAQSGVVHSNVISIICQSFGLPAIAEVVILAMNGELETLHGSLKDRLLGCWTEQFNNGRIAVNLLAPVTADDRIH